jgi:hypothetical protein
MRRDGEAMPSRGATPHVFGHLSREEQKRVPRRCNLGPNGGGRKDAAMATPRSDGSARRISGARKKTP